MPAAAVISGVLMLAKLGVNTAQRVRAIRDAELAADETIREARRQAADLSRLFSMRSMVRAEESAQIIGAQRAMLAMQGIGGGASGEAAAASAARAMAIEFEADAIQTRQRMRELSDAEANARRLVAETREQAIFGSINELIGIGETSIRAGVSASERVLQRKLLRNPDLLER